MVVGYLFRGVYDSSVSVPAAYFGEPGLVLEPEQMADGPVRGGLPFKFLVAWGEPFSGNICVKLDFMGPPIVRSDLHGEIRERNRLVH